MQIPKFNHDKRQWDKWRTFYNDLDGPFCLLDSGEIIITPDSYRTAGKYPDLNVEVVEAKRLTRSDPTPHPRFQYFKYPEGMSMPTTYVPYDQLGLSEDTHLMIDHDTRRVYAISQDISHLGGLPYHLTNERITRGIVGYVRPERDKAKQKILTRPIRLKVGTQLSKDVRTHMQDMIATAEAWFAISDIKRMNHTRQPWTDYYVSYEKQNRETITPQNWSAHDLYTHTSEPLLFTDIPIKIRLSMAVRKPDKPYYLTSTEYLVYDGPALKDDE